MNSATVEVRRTSEEEEGEVRGVEGKEGKKQ